MAVVAQRLIRTICPECGAPAEADPLELELMGLTADDVAAGDLREGAGCSLCRHSGFRGRMAIFEYLTVDNDIRAMIAEGKDGGAIAKVALQQGQRSLRDDAVAKYLEGKTTLREITKVVA